MNDSEQTENTGDPEVQSTDPIIRDPRGKLFSRRNFLTMLGGVALAGVGTVGYTFFVEPFWVKVRHVDIRIPTLPANWVGKTIMQLSDLHVGPVVPSDYLVRVLKKASELKPDLTVITGDLTDSDIPGRRAENDEAIRVLQNLTPSPHGTILVMGNHDYGPGWSETAKADDLEEKLTDAGITVLRNKGTERDGLMIGGIDDLWSPEFRPAVAARNIDFENAHIMLAHNPEICDLNVMGNFNGLVLSGHTHGGQCKPPFLPPPLLPVTNKRYTQGLFQFARGMQLYINPGIGFIKQVRFNVRPEITLFRLSS